MEFPHANIKTMIFSFEKYKAIYFRVPKVASTSILMSFRKLDNVEKCEEYDSSMFKFAFVRNPFDRLASCFRHIIQKGAMQNIQGHPSLHRNISFKQFVDVVSKIGIENMDIHFRPQYTFIPETPDFLGKFENIQNDYSIVCKKLGITSELLHQNKTDNVKFEDYYDKDIKKKVIKLYKKDFDLFGYEI